MPEISVVVCTHNRADYLARALEGLDRQTLAAERYEVIVVDNRSNDRTAAMVGAWRPRHMALHYVLEPQLGLSQARNTGWRAARGRYLAYLDDDAIPSPAWLEHALAAFAEGTSRLGMVGGKVLPIWEAPRPDWLFDDLLPYLTMVDLGDTARAVDSATGIVGANMIIARTALEEVGGFSTALGRKGGSLLSNEELALKNAMAEAGYKAFYRPDVMVQHHVPVDRISKDWFLRRFYWQGRSDAIWWHLTGRPTRMQRWRTALYALRVAWHYAGLRRKAGTERERFHAQTKIRYHLGEARSGLSWNGPDPAGSRGHG